MFRIGDIVKKKWKMVLKCRLLLRVLDTFCSVNYSHFNRNKLNYRLISTYKHHSGFTYMMS